MSDNKIKADVGSLLFIKDEYDEKKTRPHICVLVFSNEAGVPYDWLVMPITSNDGVGSANLVEVAHTKLACKSYAKINNMHTIPWSDKIEVATRKFAAKHVGAILDKLSGMITKQDSKK